MSRRATLLRRMQALEEVHCSENRVSFYIEGPEGQHWLTLSDGRSFRDEQVWAMLPLVTWTGAVQFKGVDAELALGIKEEPGGLLRVDESGTTIHGRQEPPE